MKDVVLTPDHPKELLLQKHADYIASYGVNKDEYVSSVEWQNLIYGQDCSKCIRARVGRH